MCECCSLLLLLVVVSGLLLFAFWFENITRELAMLCSYR